MHQVVNHLVLCMLNVRQVLKKNKTEIMIILNNSNTLPNGCRSVLCSKCSPSNIRRNETNDQHSFLVQWLIRLPGKQEVHGSIPCEGRVLFFCSVLWSCHHVAISVIRTRETITSERIITISKLFIK